MPEIEDVPKPAVTPVPRRPRPPLAQTQPTPQPADPPTPDRPKLEQIIPPDQLRGFNRTIDESLDRVRKALVVLGGKSLNAEQSEVANRIRTFQKQAEQAREQDPVTAVSLAKRADLLAQDLLQRLP